MGSICSSLPSQTIDLPKITIQINSTDEISISPRLFVKENSNSFASVYDVSSYPVGFGSIGEVWLCEHLRSRETRAVKIISKKLLTKEEIKNKTVLTEVDILKTLDHPCILKVFEYFEDQFNFYIVMEYCSGGDLFDELEKIDRFTEEQAAKIMQQIFSALFYMHSRNVIHRDIKLENILITDKNALTVKIVDFNIAVLKTAKAQTKMKGTPNYMAPEVIKGDYTEKCDLWSCGVLLYVLITGEFPFDAEFHEQLLAMILKAKYRLDGRIWFMASHDLKDLIEELLQKEPLKRISAEQALKHPWIQKTCIDTVDEKVFVKTLRRMKTMKMSTKIQEVFQMFLITQVSKYDEEIIKLKEVFARIDKDKNGTISKEELIDLLRADEGFEEAKISADRMLRVIDNDHSGGIDFTEFLRAVMHDKSLLTEENVRNAFYYFDKDHNEKIEKEELLEWLNEEAVIPVNIVEELIQQADINGDGYIDIEEFQEVLLDKLDLD